MRLRAVNVAVDLHNGEPWTGSEGHTGIDKRAVDHRVRIFDDHVEGDRVIDRKHHGGPYKAVYAYAHEDAEWWSAEIGRPLWPGAFGENLTTEGLDVTNAVIGEQWRIGSVTLRVVQPRIPCRVFAGFWDRPNLIKEFGAAGRPGAYLAIVETGDVGAGDSVEVIDRPSHGVTVGMVFAGRLGDKELAPKIAAAIEHLPPSVQDWLTKQLN